MDLQFYGGNCVSLSGKDSRVVVDDTLVALGGKSIVRQDDVMLLTSPGELRDTAAARLIINGPGEYEVSDLSIVGLAVRGHMDEQGTRSATMYKVIAGDVSYLFTGHIHPDLTDDQLEAIGMVDVMIVPVGGNGYTLDAGGALKLIKKIEPKIVIPTHYSDDKLHYPIPQQQLEQILRNMGMEVGQTVAKYRFKPGDVAGTTQLVVLARS